MYNLKTRKKIKTHIIVRIKLSVSENTKNPQAEVMLNLLDMSEICCIISRYSTHTTF